MSGQCLAITAMVGPPTYPAPMQRIFLIIAGSLPARTSLYRRGWSPVSDCIVRVHPANRVSSVPNAGGDRVVVADRAYPSELSPPGVLTWLPDRPDSTADGLSPLRAYVARTRPVIDQNEAVNLMAARFSVAAPPEAAPV